MWARHAAYYDAWGLHVNDQINLGASRSPISVYTHVRANVRPAQFLGIGMPIDSAR